jgi:hypothetical protein
LFQFVAGWGRNSTERGYVGSLYEVGANTPILQQLKVPLVAFDICKKSFSTLQITEQNHICAGGESGKKFF